MVILQKPWKWLVVCHKVLYWVHYCFWFIWMIYLKFHKAYFFLFAVDTNISYESSNIFEIQKTVNKELKKVRKWVDANRLAVNIEKTNFVLFHSLGHIPVSQTILKFGKRKSVKKIVLNSFAYNLIPIWIGNRTLLSSQKTVPNCWAILQNTTLCTIRNFETIVLWYTFFHSCHMVFMFRVLLAVPILIWFLCCKRKF